MKRKRYLLLLLAWWWLLFGRAMTVAAKGQLYLVDYFADASHWQVRGHTTINLDNQERALTLRLQLADETVIAPAYDGQNQPLAAQSNNYWYLYEISLQNFAVGDSFELIALVTAEGEEISFECRKNEQLILACTAYEKPPGQAKEHLKDLVWEEVGQPGWLADEGARIQVLLYRFGESLLLASWPRDLARQEDSWARVWLSQPIDFWEQSEQQPQLKLSRVNVNSSQASLSVYQFMYADDDYQLQAQVPYLSQRDQRWASELVGSSEQTIGEIGCLLTDVVMVLNYYGYYLFPDGTLLTPASLNAWLQSQPDGYVAGNLLNFVALGRLSTLLHRDYVEQGLNYPKLEYSYRDNDWIYARQVPLSLSLFAHGQPAIVEVPGHFVVATGTDDFYNWQLADPYYGEQMPDMNAYVAQGKYLRSVRRLTPSYTDQSYLVVNVLTSANENATVQIWDRVAQKEIEAQEVPLYQVGTDEYLGYQLIVAKPETGDYEVKFTGGLTGTQVQIWAYNQEGAVAVVADETVAEKSKAWQFHFEPSSATIVSETITEELTWEQVQAQSEWNHWWSRMTLNFGWQRQAWSWVQTMVFDYARREQVSAVLVDKIMTLLASIKGE
ncbi:hypothetical protein IJJ27_02310 [bacterium]|nr:hypothetical protein [bacterium]